MGFVIHADSTVTAIAPLAALCYKNITLRSSLKLGRVGGSGTAFRASVRRDRTGAPPLLPMPPDCGAMRAGMLEEDMDLLGWIIVGLLAGALARLIMPGRDPGGCVLTILLGIAGALLAGYVGRLAGLYGPGEQAGFIAAVLGSVAVLALYRFFARR
jgi:uncharacterized membrane protein YeaQ/YmgE (transglycosylase-associated protein family)